MNPTPLQRSLLTGCVLLFLFIILQIPASAQDDNTAHYDSIVNIVNDMSVSFDDKYQTVSATLNDFPAEQGIELLKYLLHFSKQEGDKSATTTLYSNILLLYAMTSQFDKAETYLDSLFIYEDELDNPTLAKLHYSLGIFYETQGKFPESHSHFYKSLEYFEKVEGTESMQVGLLSQLGTAYAAEKDTVNLRLIIQKILPLTQQLDDVASSIETYTLMGIYYSIIYGSDELQLNYLDSTITYYTKAIDIYNTIQDPPDFFNNYIADNYIRLAYYLMKLPNADWDTIVAYAEKAKELALPFNQAIFANYHLLYAEYYFTHKQYSAAQKEAEEAITLLDNMDKEEYYFMYEAAYETLSRVHEAKGEYAAALKYEKLRADYQKESYNKERYRIIQDLQTQYEVEKKEENIRQLTLRNLYQRKINYLSVGIIILVVIAILFIIFWFRNKRKSDAALLKVAELKKHEAELKAELETAKLEEMDKEYQILLNNVQQRQIQSYLEGLESERTRLAKELHDNVSNEIASVKIKLEQTDLSKAELSDVLNSLHSQVRNISHELMPPVFKYASLPDIVEDYAFKQQEFRDVTIATEVFPEEGWEELPANISLEVYRMIQEGVSNALKYASASEINIMLVKKNNQLSIRIIDNGKGFDTTKAYSGIGLKTMRERVESLRGRIAINSELKAGTEIAVDIPLSF